MAYSFTDLKNLWITDGGNPAAADIAAAVALAESGGNPLATGHNTDGSTDRGLWQINSVHGSLSTYDVTQNVKAAISISNNGSNWHPWTTFNSGAYRTFLNGASGNPPSGGDTTLTGLPNPFDVFSGIPDALKNIAGTLGQIVKVGEWFANPHNVIRIAQVVSGIGLVLVGIVVLSRGLIEEKVAEVSQIAGKVGVAA